MAITMVNSYRLHVSHTCGRRLSQMFFFYKNLTDGQDMASRADMVVHEILDTELLGEGVLPAMRDAYERLLKPGGVTVPKSATVYAQVWCGARGCGGVCSAGSE